MSYAELALRIAGGAEPPGVDLVKASPVRRVARAGDVALKVFLRPSRRAEREARALLRAAQLGVPVPELIESGPLFVVTRWIEGRPARAEDLDRILPPVERMHARGMLHGDLHLGNVLMRDGDAVLIDLHRARFPPLVPGWMRRRELGYFAFSLGEPLPDSLSHVRFWRDLRAQRHWRSRTRRPVRESSGFTRFELGGEPGFRRREADPAALERALRDLASAEPIKRDARTALYRSDGWVLKRHARDRDARDAWIGSHGLEARGIATGRALAWSGRWLVMEDAGPTLIDWVESAFAAAPEAERAALARDLAELLARLHARGIYHPDLKANNIAWRPGAPPRLLDTGRVRFGRRVSARRRAKNLAQLNAALPDVVPAALRDAALRDYLRLTGYRGDAAALRARVVRASLRRRHRWTGAC